MPNPCPYFVSYVAYVDIDFRDCHTSLPLEAALCPSAFLKLSRVSRYLIHVHCSPLCRA